MSKFWRWRQSEGYGACADDGLMKLRFQEVLFMTRKRALRVISLLMLLIAIVFVSIAINHPELGRTIYIGSFRFGYRQWQICYAVYAAVMVILFTASFLVKDRKN